MFTKLAKISGLGYLAGGTIAGVGGTYLVATLITWAIGGTFLLAVLGILATGFMSIYALPAIFDGE